MWAPAVRGVIESMNGARFVHDRLEELGWKVLIADATKVQGLAPLACKTDKIEARVLATLSAAPARRNPGGAARVRPHPPSLRILAVAPGPDRAEAGLPTVASGDGLGRGLTRVTLPLRTEAVARSRRSVRAGRDDDLVPQNFVACDREQELLLPPSLREWLPEGHLAWFVLDCADELDLTGF
jgi:hypothetical protein